MWEELSRTEGRRASSGQEGFSSYPVSGPLWEDRKAWSTVNGCGLRPPGLRVMWPL